MSSPVPPTTARHGRGAAARDHDEVHDPGPGQIFAFNAGSKRRLAFTTPFANGWPWAAVQACLILQLAAIHWPGPGVVLRTVPLTAAELAVAAAAAVAPVAVVEVVKLLLRWFGNRRDLAAEGRTSSGSSRTH
jgi:hypothetical protein